MRVAGLVGVGGGILILAACETTEEPTALEQQTADLAEFDGLVETLDARRELFVEGAAQDYTVSGARLTWIDISPGNPVLRSYDDVTGERLLYDFAPYWPGSPGSPTDNINFAVDSDLTASMNTMDELNAYDSVTGDPLGSVVLPAPPYGQKWFAYAADGGFLYVMIVRGGKHHLERFTPGSDEGDDLLTLEALIDPNAIGEFTNFTVSGDTLIFAEQGRVWVASLSGGKAKWIQNDEFVGAVSFSDDDVVYSQAARIFRYDRASDAREELTESIAAGYTLNATYPEPHLPTSTTAFSRAGDLLVYESIQGIFSYDLGSGAVEPVLLTHRDNSVIYRYPTAMEATGALFVKGLESDNGAVGADGPTWRIDL